MQSDFDVMKLHNIISYHSKAHSITLSYLTCMLLSHITTSTYHSALYYIILYYLILPILQVCTCAHLVHILEAGWWERPVEIVLVWPWVKAYELCNALLPNLIWWFDNLLYCTILMIFYCINFLLFSLWYPSFIFFRGIKLSF